jgi:3-oxoacyl-[acyl-carrier-protein] synthase-3
MGSYQPEAARRLVNDTVRIGASTLGEVLMRAGVRAADVDVVASVQPRAWIPHAIAEVAGLDADRAIETFSERAHLGTCGIVANLLAAREEGRIRPGSRVILYGQGAGFTRAAALVEWT